MEIAKFILTAIGTFVSVFAISFTVFQYWRKKQDEKFDLFRKSIEAKIQIEMDNYKAAVSRMDERLKNLENSMSQRFENRISHIEGELKGIKQILQSMHNWFMGNVSTGNKS